MAKAIWKFILYPQQSAQSLEIPQGAQLRFVGSVNDQISLWMEVDENAPTESRKFLVVRTGWELPPDREYLGTAICGAFVWHVHENRKANGVQP